MAITLEKVFGLKADALSGEWVCVHVSTVKSCALWLGLNG